MRWVRAVALVVAGLVLLVVAGVARPVPGPPPAEQNWHHAAEAVRVVSKFAELHQQLRHYIVCEETGRWDQSPCTQWWPDGRVR